MTYRKIGGMHWLAMGRVRISWCVTRKPAPKACMGFAAKLCMSDWTYAPKLLAIKALQAIAQVRS